MQRTIPMRRRAADPETRARCSETGTALVLVPCMLLILLALGAIAIDLSLLHGAHRSAHRTASAAADDAAAMIDTSLLQRTGELRIEPEAAARVAAAHVDAAALPGRLDGAVSVSVAADGATLDVRISVLVDHVLLGALPGVSDRERITVGARARLNR